MQLIGITGGIASGKTTVSTQIQQADIPIIDCDKLAADVVQKGHWGYNRVRKAFPNENILLLNGEIDREALGHLVFNDRNARRKLNTATHLPIFIELLKRITVLWLTCHTRVVIDMPLLFESGFWRVTKSRNILVACSPDIQLQRLMHRDGSSREAAEARINSQMPLEQKKKMADIVINNDGDLEELKRQVDDVVKAVLKRPSWVHQYILSPVCVVGAALSFVFSALYKVNIYRVKYVE